MHFTHVNNPRPVNDTNHLPSVRAIASLIIAVVLCYGMIVLFQPFFLSMAIGAIIALLCHPIYTRVHRFIPYPILAAACTILLFGIVLCIPLGAIVAVLVKEMSTISAGVHSHSYTLAGLDSAMNAGLAKIGLPDQHVSADAYIARAVDYLVNRSTTLVGGVFGILGSLVITFISSFYILQNTKRIRDNIIAFSPLGKTDTNLIMRRARQVVHATVSGNLVLLALQGTTSVIWLSLVGVGSPVVIGLFYGIASLVPAVGTSLVWVPMALYYIVTGKLVIGLIIVGFALSQVVLFDNFLGPYLIERRAHLHPFFVLLGVLGGVAQFGVLGIILGPTVVALGIVGLEILRRSWQSPLDSDAYDHQTHSNLPENADSGIS